MSMFSLVFCKDKSALCYCSQALSDEKMFLYIFLVIHPETKSGGAMRKLRNNLLSFYGANRFHSGLFCNPFLSSIFIDRFVPLHPEAASSVPSKACPRYHLCFPWSRLLLWLPSGRTPSEAVFPAGRLKILR